MIGHGISRAQAAVAGAAALSVLGLLLVLAAAPIRTNDLWFHLAAGRAYAAEGPWPASDPMLYTAHADAPVQHEWLFGLATFALHTIGGFGSLRLAHALAVLATAALAYACFRRAGVRTAIALSGTTAFLALGWWRLIQLRPDLVSIPATLATYMLLLSGPAPPSRRQIAGAAAIALVWANMHSLFAIGPALLIAGLIALGLRTAVARHALEGDARHARVWAGALAALLGAALLNPRGAGQHLTFLTSSRDTAIWQIADEWSHFDPFHWPDVGPMLSPLSWMLANALIAATLALGGVRLITALRAPSAQNTERLDAVHWGLAVAGVVAMGVSIRFLWMGIFPLLYLARAANRDRFDARRADWAAALAAVAIAAAFPAWGGLLDRAQTLPRAPGSYLALGYDARPFQPRGAAFLLATGVSGNLFNRYTHGGFLGYWLAPRLRTFVDGRTEHYPADVLDDYFRINQQLEVRPGESALEALDRRGVDLYLGVGLPVEGEAVYTTARLDRAPGWIPISRSVDHSVSLRAGERNRENLDRVAAYYAEAGVPFDRERGFDPLIAARTRPDWAVEHGVVPADYSELVTERSSEDPAVRVRALDRLALLLYLLGAYDAQIALDRELVGLEPDAVAPRRRLVLSLLRLGRDSEAALQVSDVARITGNRPPTVILLRLVKQVEQLRIEPGPVPAEAAINAVPAVSRDDLTRFFAEGPPRLPELERD